MNTHLKQLWAAMKLPKNFKKSYKFFCLGLDIRVTQSVERNVRKLIGWLLVCIVAIYGILEGGVGCGVAHHGAIRLGKEPVVALPVGTQRFLCFGLLDHHAVEPICQESGDADLSAGVFRFRCFADLLAVHYCCGFGDADGAVLKVNIRPLQRQHFSFPQTGEDSQIEKNSELFRHGSGQRVITNLILDAGVIHPAVPSCIPADCTKRASGQRRSGN